MRRVFRWLVGVPVAVVAVACSTSSTDDAAVTPPPMDDAGIDAPPPPEDAPAEARALGCPGETPTTYAWAPPVPKANVCTADDIARLAALVAKSSLVTDAQVAEALGPTCAACAVGKVSDATWRAYVSGHEAYTGNVGGCAMLLGANETCGRAIDTLSTCLIVGCAGCSGRKAQDACADMLTTVDGACAGALKTTRAKCPAAALASAFDTNGACQSFAETVRLFCGPPS